MIVRVYNKNVHTYSEKWHGTQFTIEPGAFVEMDLYDAHNFLGTKPPNIEVDGNGIQKPTSYKMLEIVKPDSIPKVAAPIHHICQACNKEFGTKAALNNHAETAHFEAMVDEEIVEAIVKKRGRRPKGTVNDSIGNRDSGETKV